MVKWIYVGVFIDTFAKMANLKALVENNVVIPDDWKLFNHHMTIVFNNGSQEAEDLYDEVKKNLGKKKHLIVTGIGVSDDAIAVRVIGDMPMANKIPHITIATPKNGKPVNSNYITKWIDIEPYTICGTIEQFAK